MSSTLTQLFPSVSTKLMLDVLCLVRTWQTGTWKPSNCVKYSHICTRRLQEAFYEVFLGKLKPLNISLTYQWTLQWPCYVLPLNKNWQPFYSEHLQIMNQNEKLIDAITTSSWYSRFKENNENWAVFCSNWQPSQIGEKYVLQKPFDLAQI